MEISQKRRLTLTGLTVGLAASGLAWLGWPRGGLLNPCGADLPGHLQRHALLLGAWEGLDSAACWDTHAHLLGTGDSGSGIYLNPRMNSMLSPFDYMQRRVILNAGCVDESPGRADASYVSRLRALAQALGPEGAGRPRLMLFAFDCHVLESGEVSWPRTSFHVPDAYAARMAQAHPQQFEWAASVHPYRKDAVERVEQARANGARAIKWLPASMGIDPASPLCERFYDTLARHDLPLVTHAGLERAVQGVAAQHLGNPLRLRRALERGVRVVVAHCASLGEDVDLDRGAGGPAVSSFSLFERLMGEPRWHGRLFGDISAMTQINRAGPALARVIERDDWQGRLLNGSDYPLVGVMPLVSPERLAAMGFLDAAAVPVLYALREHNALLFDFVTKRSLRWQGKKLANRVFETRSFFEKRTVLDSLPRRHGNAIDVR